MNAILCLTPQNMLFVRAVCGFALMFSCFSHLCLATEVDPAHIRERNLITKKIEQLKNELSDHLTDERIIKLGEMLEQKASLERKMFGTNCLEAIDTLEQLAFLLEKFGDYENSVLVRQELVKMQTAAHGEKDWRVVTANLDLSEAIECAKLTKEQLFNLLEAIHIHKDKADKLVDSGKLGEAIMIVNARLRTIGNILGKDNQRYIGAHKQKTELLRLTSNMKSAQIEANELVTSSLRVFGSRHPYHAACVHAQALINMESGSYDAAINQFRFVKSVIAEKFSEFDPRYGASSSSLGEVYKLLGNFKAALAEHEAAVKCLAKAGDEYRAQYVLALNNLGGTLNYLGEYAESVRAFRTALTENERCPTPDPVRKGIVLRHFASVYIDHGDLNTADTILQEAVQLTRQGSPLNHADTLQILGMFHKRMFVLQGREADFEAALRYHRQALEFRSTHLVSATGARIAHVLIGRSHANLGGVYAARARWANAIAEYTQALDVLKKSVGSEHHYVGGALLELGKVRHLNGQSADALLLCESAARILERTLSGRHISTLNAWNTIAYILHAMGRREEALASQRRAVEAATDEIRTQLLQFSKRQRMLFLLTRRHHLDTYLWLAIQCGKDASEVYAIANQFKGLLTASATMDKFFVGHSNATELANQYLTLCDSIKAIASKASSTIGQNSLDEVRRLETEKEKLEERLSTSGMVLPQLDPLTNRSVQARLSSNTALIDYICYSCPTGKFDANGRVLHQFRVAAFILRFGHKPVLEDLGPLEPIKEIVGRWQLAVHEGLVPFSGKELAHHIWEPVSRHLQGIQNVIIIPDGPICSVAFAALPGKNDNTVLLDDYAIWYQNSIQQWFVNKTRTRPTNSTSAIVFGLPDFGPGKPMTNSRFEPILRTLNSKPLERLFDGLREYDADARIKSYIGQSATASQFRETFLPNRQSQNCQYLHLETHGFWTTEAQKLLLPDETAVFPFADAQTLVRNPEFRTGLAFAGANESPSCILTGEELGALDLRSVDCAVLASCYGAIGDTHPGEGAFALHRAFHVAGAKTVIASTWAVPAPDTQRLMAEFYQNMWVLGPNKKLESLRRAQLTIRQKNASVQPPLYWASWILNGDPGDLSGSEISTRPAISEPLAPDAPNTPRSFESLWLFIVGGVGVIAVIVCWYRKRK